MALILYRYSRYFIKGALNHKKYEDGYRAYFDPNRREFIWLKPEDLPNLPYRLVPLPVISEYETYHAFLMAQGHENILHTYIELNETDFCIAVRREAETAGFDDALRAYAIKEYSNTMQQWITNNAIENCKLSIDPYEGPLAAKADIEDYLRFTKDQIQYEAGQEAAFKKSLL